VDCVRQEFAALPGLRLTEPQVCRIWNLTPPLASTVLDRLVHSRVLKVTGSGQFVRTDLTLEEEEEGELPVTVVRARR
jgi:hypothetical protein